MIKVNNVTKTFDGFRALDGLTMTVEQGSIYGLVGPNGAGKSTILRHITGIYRQDEGTVTVDGQTLEDGTVTVRHRDTMRQERVPIESLPSLVDEECSYRKLFKTIESVR